MTPGARSILLVAWREITERMQSRAFAVSTLAIVALVVGGIGVILGGLALLSKSGRQLA